MSMNGVNYILSLRRKKLYFKIVLRVIKDCDDDEVSTIVSIFPIYCSFYFSFELLL